MNAILKRTIDLESLIVYAEIEIPEQRDDIKNYLTKNLGKNDTFHQKIQSHLRNIGLLNRGNSLTQKGQEVVDTGKLSTSEYGKFQIWSTRWDELTGEYFLAFKRRKAEKDELPNIELENDAGGEFLSYLIEKKPRLEKITLKNLGKKKMAQAIEASSETKLQLTWKFPEGSKTNELQLHGTLKEKDISQQINHAIDHNFSHLSLTDLLEDTPSWHSEQRRLRIDLESMSKETLQSFIQKTRSFYLDSTKYGEFHQATLNDVPVMPINEEVAEKWLEKLLRFEAEKGFLLEAVFNQKSIEFCEHEALAYYSPTIPTLENELSKSASKNKAFWNMAAPFDLNPFKKIKKKEKKIFNLIPNRQYSFKDIAQKLVPKADISHLVICDRYINKQLQQDSFETFGLAVRGLKGEIPLVLVTLNKNNYRPSLPNTSIIDFRGIGHQDHDRFLIFVKKSGDWVIWKASKSMDYLQFHGGIIRETTNGYARESVTFVQVGKELLTAGLKQSIQSKIKSSVHQTQH